MLTLNNYVIIFMDNSNNVVGAFTSRTKANAFYKTYTDTHPNATLNVTELPLNKESSIKLVGKATN